MTMVEQEQYFSSMNQVKPSYETQWNKTESQLSIEETLVSSVKDFNTSVIDMVIEPI